MTPLLVGEDRGKGVGINEGGKFHVPSKVEATLLKQL